MIDETETETENCHRRNSKYETVDFTFQPYNYDHQVDLYIKVNEYVCFWINNWLKHLVHAKCVNNYILNEVCCEFIPVSAQIVLYIFCCNFIQIAFCDLDFNFFVTNYMRLKSIYRSMEGRNQYTQESLANLKVLISVCDNWNHLVHLTRYRH